MLPSASGTTLMATGEAGVIAFLDMSTGAHLADMVIGAMDEPWQHPVQVWDGQPIVITPLGDVYVITGDVPATPMADVTG